MRLPLEDVRLHDAIAAERRGTPAAAVMTDRFIESSRAMATLNGLPDYPFAVIGHPIANNDDHELRKKAEGVVDEVVRLPTQGRISSSG